MSKITIGKKEYNVEEELLNQCELLFYEENPRVYSILRSNGTIPTQKEIEAKMKEECLTNWCTMLEDAYDKMEFGEEETVVIKVVKGEDELYKLEESAITQFLVKILSLDEKQD